jgi:hypothetical protein
MKNKILYEFNFVDGEIEFLYLLPFYVCYVTKFTFQKFTCPL